MHRTLKRDCTRPPRASRRAQPQRFDAWRREFNELRPHQALGDATPASYYRPSCRPYPRHLLPFEYPGHYEVRRVSYNGGIRWCCTWVNVRQTLGGEVLGFVEIDDGEWDVYFGPLRLGRFHERALHIEDTLAVNTGGTTRTARCTCSKCAHPARVVATSRVIGWLAGRLRGARRHQQPESVQAKN